MNYVLKKYSNLKSVITEFTDKLRNSTHLDVEEKLELLLSTRELNLKAPCVHLIINEIAGLQVDKIDLLTALIRQHVLIKYDIRKEERKDFITYWLYDEFYKKQNFATVCSIFWLALEDYELLSEEWKVKLPKKIKDLEKTLKSTLIRAWLPRYLEKFDHIELAAKVLNEILALREKNGSWDGNVEKTVKIAFALSCSKHITKEILQKSIDFINNRIALGINLNVKNCALILKLYHRIGITGDDLVNYIQDNIKDDQSLSLERNDNDRPPKNKVFISYCHTDEKWLKRIIVHLKPLEREGLLELWSDKNIKAGDKWKMEINNALEMAGVAVLLISADFLASDLLGLRSCQLS